MKKSLSKTQLADYFLLVLGSAIFSYGLVAFTTPNDIVPTGITGVAHILLHVFGLSMGATIFLSNIILVIFQAKILGTRSVTKTLFVTGMISLSLEIMNVYKDHIAVSNIDPLIACIFGSLICGIGISLTFKAGGNSGGLDIVCQILQHKWNIPVTDSRMASNIAIVLCAGKIFGLHPMLYSIIYVYLTNVVIDAFLDGMSVFRNVLIITNEGDLIGWAIIEDLRRGVTSLTGTGIYSGKEINVLMTAIKRGELHTLEKIVYTFDSKAFMIVCDARRIIGRGFTKLEDEVRFDDLHIIKQSAAMNMQQNIDCKIEEK